jgi:hypothetical protein
MRRINTDPRLIRVICGTACENQMFLSPAFCLFPFALFILSLILKGE